MRYLSKAVSADGLGTWLKDVAALISIGAFIFVAGAWGSIAETLIS